MMEGYIDGYAFPIAKDKLEQYQKIADEIANIWLEYGALEYKEFVGDDLNPAGTLSFLKSLEARPGDTIIFGWIKFKSREDRDHAHQKVQTDPRMEPLVAPLMGVTDKIFDPTLMAFGGFTPIVDSAL